MKISKLIAVILIVVLFALTAASQISQDTPLSNFIQRNFNQITSKISLEEKQDCTINYYNQIENIYGNVTRIRDIYGACFNPANQSNYTCVTGTEFYQNYEVIGIQTAVRNNTDCRTSSYIVS